MDTPAPEGEDDIEQSNVIVLSAASDRDGRRTMGRGWPKPAKSTSPDGDWRCTLGDGKANFPKALGRSCEAA